MKPTYIDRIKDIAQRKVLSRAFNGKTPKLGYGHLSHIEQTALVQALIDENDEIRELIANHITNDIEDAYCDEIRISEAEEDAIELEHLRADIGQRSRDMNQQISGSL